jgi:hypothetical protein
MVFRTPQVILFSALFLLSSCIGFHSHPKPSILPPYIHKIAVRPFSNHTQQYGLEDKLTLAVQSEFNTDGRYQITTEDQADAVLVGDVTRYTLLPMSYDTNHVPTEYELTILVDVSFEDKVEHKELWKEPGMNGDLRYFAASSGLAGSMSETDAQTVIWDELSRDIRTRTIEGFGGSTATKSNTGPSKSLPPLNNAPPPMPSDKPSSPPAQQPY